MHCKLFSQLPSYISFGSVILLIFVSINIITVISISSISVVTTFLTVIIITAFLVR